MGFKDFVNGIKLKMKYEWSPKVIDLFAFPQTIKKKDVQVEKDPETGLYVHYDPLGMPELYFPLIIKDDYVEFNDGQVMKKGDVAFFKIEPVEFVVTKELYYDGKKSGVHGLVSSKILAVKGVDVKKFFFYDKKEIAESEFEELLKGASFSSNTDCTSIYNWYECKKVIRKQVTDFAIALGIYHKRKYGNYGYYSSTGRLYWTDGKQGVAPSDMRENEVGVVFTVRADKRSVAQEIKETKKGRAEDKQHKKEIADFYRREKEKARAEKQAEALAKKAEAEEAEKEKEQ